MLPEGADAYVLSRALHEGTDEQAIQILATTRRAMADGAALLLVERVLDSQSPSPEATLTDIHMLVMTGGRERTTEEFQVLLAASGFELVRRQRRPPASAPGNRTRCCAGPHGCS